MAAQVLTGNRLSDGATVYLTVAGEWTRKIGRAVVAENEAAAAALAESGERAVCERRVVAPYLIEVERVAGDLRPSRYRERLRADGGTSIRFGAAAWSA